MPLKRTLTEEDHARAEAVSTETLHRTILNIDIAPNWIEGGDAFWYRRFGKDGVDFVRVDCLAASKAPAFDHSLVALALSAEIGEPVDPRRLPFSNFEYLNGAKVIQVRVSDNVFRIDLLTGRCDRRTETRGQPHFLVSPNGRSAITCHGEDLHLRDLVTGDERPLTSDGEPFFSWTKPHEAGLKRLMQLSRGIKAPLLATSWSPDSRWIVAARTDEREVPEYPFIKYCSANEAVRPQVLSLRINMAADSRRTPVELVAIETISGRRVRLGGDAMSLQGVALLHWDPSGTSVYHLAIDSGRRRVRLMRTDLDSGTSHCLIEETARTPVMLNPLLYSMPNLKFLWRSGTILWYSEKTGYGHLYLHDLASGNEVRQLTSGEWVVRDILYVDEASWHLWITASGREAGENPYFRHLYRLCLENGSLTRLTSESGDHHFTSPPHPRWLKMTGQTGPMGYIANPGEKDGPPSLISPNGKYFLDSWSTVESPTRSAVRRADGSLVLQLEDADLSAVRRDAWPEVKPFIVTAADGRTPLYGAVLLPPGLDPSGSYPVVEFIYSGPNVVTAPISFPDLLDRNEMGLAAIGCVTVILNARGTPVRSRGFREYIFDCMATPSHDDTWAIADHVTALQQL
ncbi:MAG TPA: DPP IV N-terminal domain-containing protein, partial [Bryobacteraceae bacterium]